MNLKEEMIFISGMLEGLNLTSGEGAVITRMASVLSDMAAKITELEERTALLSEDVQDVSDIALGLDSEDDDDFSEELEEGLEEELDEELEELFDDEDDDDDLYLRCTCPECHRPFYVQEALRGEDTLFTCPSCQAKVKAVADFEADEDILVAEPVSEEE